MAIVTEEDVRKKAYEAFIELTQLLSRILDEEDVREPMRSYLLKGVDSLLGEATKVIAHPAVDLKIARIFDRLAMEAFRFSEAAVAREMDN